MVICIFVGIALYFTQAWLKYQNSFKYLSLLMITTAALKSCCPWYHLHSHRNINRWEARVYKRYSSRGTGETHSFILLMLHNSIIRLTCWNICPFYSFFLLKFIYSNIINLKTGQKKNQRERSNKCRIQILSFGPLNIFTGSNFVQHMGILKRKHYEETLLKAGCYPFAIRHDQSKYESVL